VLVYAADSVRNLMRPAVIGSITNEHGPTPAQLKRIPVILKRSRHA
jgi:hypothetical protein